jgi:hypothetical protein
MAQFAVHGTPRSVVALAALFTFVGLLVFAMAGGFPDAANHKLPLYGLLLYALAIAVIALGFWSKEDIIAVLGIMALSGLIILDILLRVGVLSYNGIRVL